MRRLRGLRELVQHWDASHVGDVQTDSVVTTYPIYTYTSGVLMGTNCHLSLHPHNDIVCSGSDPRSSYSYPFISYGHVRLALAKIYNVNDI